MPLSSLLLVLLAATTHASWNAMAKRSARVGAPFLFWSSALSVLIYAPWALWTALHGSFAWTGPVVACIVASGLIHTAYSFALQHGYKVADLSVVYPIARGTGPLLSSCGAFLLLAEVPGILRLLGLAAVVGGILLIATEGRFDTFARPGALAGLRWGVLTGACIAAYTLVDSYGVKVLLIAPVLLDCLANTLRTAVLLPSVLHQRARVGGDAGALGRSLGGGAARAAGLYPGARRAPARRPAQRRGADARNLDDAGGDDRHDLAARTGGQGTGTGVHRDGSWRGLARAVLASARILEFKRPAQTDKCFGKQSRDLRRRVDLLAVAEQGQMPGGATRGFRDRRQNPDKPCFIECHPASAARGKADLAARGPRHFDEVGAQQGQRPAEGSAESLQREHHCPPILQAMSGHAPQDHQHDAKVTGWWGGKGQERLRMR